MDDDGRPSGDNTLDAGMLAEGGAKVAADTNAIVLKPKPVMPAAAAASNPTYHGKPSLSPPAVITEVKGPPREARATASALQMPNVQTQQAASHLTVRMPPGSHELEAAPENAVSAGKAHILSSTHTTSSAPQTLLPFNMWPPWRHLHCRLKLP